MTNKNVIEIIDRLVAPHAERLVGSANEVFAAIIHGYYYIRPGKNTSKFLDKINKVLERNWKYRSNMYVETKDGTPFEAYLWGNMAGEALFIARSMFDKDYYISQLANMTKDEVYDETLLKSYMHWLNDEELKSVFEGMLTFKSTLNVFISDKNFNSMMEELKNRSLAVVENSPWYMKNYNDHIDNIENNWDFCFSYLRRESIIEIVCNYVDEDPLMLATMIKAFMCTDERTAAEYTGLAIWLAYGYDLDPFEVDEMIPTDVDDFDEERSWKMRSNQVGKMEIGVRAK
jgi:hypothetical protein